MATATKPRIPAEAPTGTRIIRSRDGLDYGLAVRLDAQNIEQVAQYTGAQIMVSEEVLTSRSETVIYLSAGEPARKGDWVILHPTPQVAPRNTINRQWVGERGGVLSGR